MDLPTVRVKHPELEGGVMIINQADYDPAVHEQLEAPAVQTSANPEMEAAIARNAARLARRDELSALKFVELKEKIADLGVAIVKTGTTKEDLVSQILD